MTAVQDENTFMGADAYLADDDDDLTPPIQIVTPAISPTPAQAVPVATVVDNRGIPDFEKAKVAKTLIRIQGTTDIDTYDDVTVSLDDRLRAVGEFRVVAVRFIVDKKTGDVVREQIIAPVDPLQLVPWDPSDPNDKGVLKARP